MVSPRHVFRPMAQVFLPSALVVVLLLAGCTAGTGGDDGVPVSTSHGGAGSGSGGSGGGSGGASSGSGGGSGGGSSGGTGGGQGGPSPGSGSEEGLDECGRPIGNVTDSRVKVNEGGNFSGNAHQHSWWECETQLVILDRDIGTGPGGVCAGYLAPTNPAGANGCNQGESLIRLAIVDEPNTRPNIVYPGTGSIEFKLSVAQLLHPFEFGAAYPYNGVYRYVKFKVDATQKTFVIEGLNDTNTDLPHSRASSWNFGVFTTAGSAPHPASLYVGPFHLKITVFRDLQRQLPVDPPHPDYWGGATSKVLYAATKACAAFKVVLVSSNGCTGPSLVENNTVMIGTAKVQVTLKWAAPSEPFLQKFGLLYCAMACGTGGDNIRPPPTIDEANRRVWDINVRPEEWDSPYNKNSRWSMGVFLQDQAGQDNGRFNGNIEWKVEIFKIP